MKLLLLSDINSSHTQKWAIALSIKGFQVGIFSISTPLSDWYSQYAIQLIYCPGATITSKIGYLKLLPKLKEVIRQFKPQIIHAHYATSYGLLGALCGFHPFVISAWGSDVMDFPNRSWLHKALIKFNFNNADSIWATSDIIVSTINRLSKKNVHKIAFGIDTNIFKPINVTSVFYQPCIVIGTVKSMETIYGIDILIKAFKKVHDKNAEIPLKLLIVGGGSMEKQYKLLVKKLKIEDKTIFTGKINHSEIVNYHNMIDIFINVSRNESFGVSVLEASACEKPVIASNIGGLPEVVDHNNTGFLVELENMDEVAAAIEKLVKNSSLRKKMGENGRLWVQQKFDLNNNVNDAILVYKKLIDSQSKI